MINKLIRFVLVGILNTLFSYSIYALMIFLHLHYSLALFIAATSGALFNFKTIGHLVFNDGDNRLLFRFLGVYLVTYLMNVAAMKLFASYHMDLYVAGIVLALPMALVAFVLHNTFVFGKENVPAVN